MAQKADEHVAGESMQSCVERSKARSAMCHGDHAVCNGAPLCRPIVERPVISGNKFSLQRLTERHGILDAGVHSLPACRAVNVSGVSGEQNSALPKDRCETMMNVEA